MLFFPVCKDFVTVADFITGESVFPEKGNIESFKVNRKSV